MALELLCSSGSSSQLTTWAELLPAPESVQLHILGTPGADLVSPQLRLSLSASHQAEGSTQIPINSHAGQSLQLP